MKVPGSERSWDLGVSRFGVFGRREENPPGLGAAEDGSRVRAERTAVLSKIENLIRETA
jgi:hypothetical protein